MAAISAPTPHKLTFPNSIFPSSPLRRPFSPSRVSLSDSSLCRCQSSSSSSSSPSPSDSHWRWDSSAIADVVKTAVKRFDSFLNSRLNRSAADSPAVAESDAANSPDDDPAWDWDRWRKHFAEVDEISVLKAQLGRAIHAEEFEEAARLKVAIAAAATNDVVGREMYKLNRAIQEERYREAAFIRDNAGAGLVGWWAGNAKDINDPHGLIIRITAEHGKYVARSYSPRQLATAAAGNPLFEIFLTVNKKGEYRQQAVYLKRGNAFQDIPVSSRASGFRNNVDPLDSTEDKNDLLVSVNEDTEDEDDSDRDDVSDPAQGISSFQNILRDMIPGVKVKVLKVTAPGKVDKDLISKVIEQIIEEDDEEKDDEIENIEDEDEAQDESDQERDVIELDGDPGFVESEERKEIAFKVVVGGLMQKMSSGMLKRDVLRVPAKLEKNGRLSFSFSIENDASQQESRHKESASKNKKSKLRGRRSIDHVMLDLTKFIGREKIPLKVLKDVGELISLTLSQAQNHQPLSGSTTFNRIDLPTSSDPLNGLYIGAHGLYTSEVIHLQRKFGQWKEDNGTMEPSNLEFYEYVEALKITGDPYVPAGQVAFRAKVGKRYQLPHKGIIPEEFGVIARYKGQGRLAAPGFRNPRWVDGELVILDGKYIKSGPVVGFVYWAPEYHFLVFFNRLRLQD
ncbi:protein EXECUTER 1, chloroplastic [Morus notabilis]|uniref:protein EXECUTER 1, chloroplastic n=1 Tax=Morus notabilis TaxID=981085 RepID=UPI000CECF958|nr:protein EXECUTER 1, chloroplastic [Morus notabilis]XP_024017585.1 protein EXECUTER 1, chloroplastic [Morus notabilis]